MVERKEYARSFFGYATRLFAVIGGMYKVGAVTCLPAHCGCHKTDVCDFPFFLIFYLL